MDRFRYAWGNYLIGEGTILLNDRRTMRHGILKEVRTCCKRHAHAKPQFRYVFIIAIQLSHERGIEIEIYRESDSFIRMYSWSLPFQRIELLFDVRIPRGTIAHALFIKPGTTTCRPISPSVSLKNNTSDVLVFPTLFVFRTTVMLVCTCRVSPFNSICSS